MLRVVLLNWRDYLGRGDDYVRRMRSMVDRHLTLPHRFTVVTEDDLPTGRAGWFNKLHLLEMFDDEVLYLDLDVVITGNIDHIVTAALRRPDLVHARDDWSYPVTNPQHGREATINSSVMVWCGRKDMTGAEALIPVTHGDQGIITQLFWPHGIGLLPNDQVKSYKYDYLQGGGYGPITVFHGSPKCHEVREKWVTENWR